MSISTSGSCFPMLLKIPSVCISTAKQLSAGRIDAVRCCGRDEVAHKWGENITAYLEKSFLGLSLGMGALVVSLIPVQTVGGREDTTSTP